MSQPVADTGFQVSLGGKRFDPLSEQRVQEQNSNNVPGDPDVVAAWIIQFRERLTKAEMAELRTRHGLALSEYLPPRSYIERLTGREMEGVRVDERVRAVMRFLGDFKLAVGARVLNDNQDRVSAEPIAIDAILFPQANADTVLERITLSGAQNARLIDDRAAGGGVVVRFDLVAATDLRLLADLEDVRWLEPVAVDIDDQDRIGAAGRGRAELPLGILVNLHGEGQTIGLIDKGQPEFSHCFFTDPAQPRPGPEHRKVLQVRNKLSTPSSDHATFTAGIAAGDDVNQRGVAPHRGLAWAAKLVCGNRLDLRETTLFAELTAAGKAEARIHSNSWHSRPLGAGIPPNYDARSAEVDSFTSLNEDHLVVGSSGNTGEEQGPPGSAKNAICVSCASLDPAAPDDGDGNPGPTVDGRRKPDLIASGCQIISSLRDVVDGIRCSTGLLAPCASSFATPRVAALAAIARQYFTEGFHPSGHPTTADRFTPSGALLKAVMLNAALPVDARRAYPNDVEGWGFLDSLDSLVPTDEGRRLLLWDVRNVDGLTTGDHRSHDIDVMTTRLPLRITLVWTDPAGPVGTDLPLVNDLDLVVASPTGANYRGNVFKDGTSVEGGPADRIDNVEMVVRATPEPGRWVVDVHAHEVNVQGAQGYALVVTGGLRFAP